MFDIGDEITFDCLTRVEFDFPSMPGQKKVHYCYLPVSGKVVRVRDLDKEPLKNTRRKVERSYMLVVLKLPDGKIKSYYNNRMFNARVNKNIQLELDFEPVDKLPAFQPAKPKGFFRKVLRKLGLGV